MLVMNGAGRVNLGVRVGGEGGEAELDSCTRGTIKQGVQRLCLLPMGWR